MEERLGEMRKGRRERMRKGAIVSSSPQGICWKLNFNTSLLQRFTAESSRELRRNAVP